MALLRLVRHNARLPSVAQADPDNGDAGVIEEASQHAADVDLGFRANGGGEIGGRRIAERMGAQIPPQRPPERILPSHCSSIARTAPPFWYTTGL
jgi:hypothetical protein